MGLYKDDLCVSNKQASHKQENKHVLITRFDYAILKLKLKDNV
jgi:hypothetical protein